MERTEERPDEVSHPNSDELLRGRDRVIVHATETLRNRNMLTVPPNSLSSQY